MWVLSLIAFSHRPACFWLRAATGPLGSRAWSFYACMGSTTPQGRCALASFRTPRLVLRASRTPSAPWIGDFGAQYPACIYPCPTLQVRPHDCPRMVRRQSGLLLLSLYDSLIHYSTPVYPDLYHRGAGHAVGAGRIFVRSSPNPTRMASRSAEARMITVSPSSRKRRTAPSGNVSGLVPFQQISSIEPNESGVGPLIVPEAQRSPMRRLVPFEVRCANC